MAKQDDFSEKDLKEFDAFARLAEGMETRRVELLADAHRRAEMELYQYRMTVLKSLKKLLSKHSISQIAKKTGLARSTIYRWVERLRNEDLIAEAASKGIRLDSANALGGLGGGATGHLFNDTDLPEATPVETAADLGWKSSKKIASGEVSTIDIKGDTWLLNGNGEAWNKTQNAVVSGFDDWPKGAREVFDILSK